MQLPKGSAPDCEKRIRTIGLPFLMVIQSKEMNCVASCKTRILNNVCLSQARVRIQDLSLCLSCVFNDLTTVNPISLISMFASQVQ